VDIPFSTPKGAGTGLSASTGNNSSSTAKPISSGATGSIDDNSSTQEQRSIGTSQSGEGEGESSEAPRPARAQEASKEALQGPQGPAPKAAEDFANESKGKKPAGGDVKGMFSSLPFFGCIVRMNTDV
jgi:hypothetical protein